MANEVIGEPPTLTEAQKIYASNPSLGVGVGFGNPVVIDGDTALIIGGIVSDDEIQTVEGFGYVFNRDTDGRWMETQILPYDGYPSGRRRSKILALDGDTAALGVPKDKGCGSVSVWAREHGAWTLQDKIVPEDCAYDYGFGSSVSLNKDTLLIGAPADRDRFGSAYVYRRVSGAWHMAQKLVPSASEYDDSFGEAAAINGNLLLVSAPSAQDGLGAVYSFEFQRGSWIETQILTSGSPQGDLFGNSVDLDRDSNGRTFAVIGMLGGRPSRSFVYERIGNQWVIQQELNPSGFPGSGMSGQVCLIGSTVVMYEYWGVYVIPRINGAWHTSAILAPSDGDFEKHYGYSIGADGNTVLVGAPEDKEAGSTYGAAYVFDLEELGGEYEVGIDIKPGNERNVINPRSKGRFWVAMLSDEGFDALQVDPETVAFGPGAASPDRYKVKDANRDRLPDLMVRFRTPAVGLQCGDTELELTGETYAGDSIIGTDAVKTVGCKKPKKGKKK